MSKVERLIKKLCPDGVEYKPLEEIFNIRNGYTPSKSNPTFWSNGTVPWFRMEDIRKNGRILSDSIQLITLEAVKGKLFPANSIIISTTATIGEHALLTADSLANQRFTFLSRKVNRIKDVEPMFAYYYCFRLGAWCKENTNVSSFPSVEMRKFRKFPFPLPPLAVQEEIVRILDKFTLLTAELTAELTARKKQYEYYRDDLLHGKNNYLETELNEIASYTKARIDAKELNTKNYIGVDNLLQEKKGRVGATYIPTSGKWAQFKVGDILIGNIRPYLKKIWKSTTIGGTNGDVLVMQINKSVEEIITSDYLYHVLASDKFFAYNIQHSKGAKMPRGDKKAIMRYKIPIPPLTEQARIVAILDRFDTLVNDISKGLPAEIEARRKQYEHYRDKLLTFKEKK